jgi:protein O-mannosyl-transferase
MAKKEITTSQANLNIKPKTWYILFGVICFLFYGNSISNGYSLDDELVTTTDRKEHQNVEKGIKGIKSIFTSNYAIDGKQNYEYRPIVTLSYAIEKSIFGASPNRPHFSHFINIALYAICGILLFQLLQVLFKHQASLFSGLIVCLFLVHPLHSEVVNNLKNRDEILSLIFAVLSALYLFKFLDDKKWYYLIHVAVFFVTSLLSKKSNLPFVVLIPLMIWFFRDLKWKKLALTFFVLFIAQLFMKLIKYGLLEKEKTRFFSYIENPLFELGFIERIPMYFYSNLFYIQKFVFPYPLNFYYGYNAIPLVGFTDWEFILGFIILLVGLYFAFRGFFKKSLLSFGILFFLFAIGGAANLLNPMVGIVGERFAFSASFGLCIVTVWGAFKYYSMEITEKSWNKKLTLPIAIIAIPFLIFTIQRNKDWNSKLSLYLADSENMKSSAKVNSLLGTEYQEAVYSIQQNGNGTFQEMMQKVDSSILFYKRSLAIYPKYESSLNNIGVLHYSFKYDYIEAISSLKKSVSVNPKYHEGMLNVANSYAKIAESYHSLLKLFPSSIEPKLTNPTIDSYVRKQKLYRTLTIINQFQVSANKLLQISFNQASLANLTELSVNLESIDSKLQGLNFSQAINTELNRAFQTKSKPNLNILNSYRIQILNELKTAYSFTDIQLGNDVFTLKKMYLDSAKIYYDKTYKLKPKLESFYNSVNQFALLLEDYPMLINVQQKFMKAYPKGYFGPQYVQMANAYFSVGEQEKAKENFKKGLMELSREKADLTIKKEKSAADIERIQALERELKNLKNYVQRIKSGEIPLPKKQ